MYPIKRFATVSSTAAALALAIAAPFALSAPVAIAQTPAATAAASTNPAAACDPAFGRDVTAIIATVNPDTLNQPALIGSTAQKLIRLRETYEDTNVPAACEPKRQTALHLLGFSEDLVFATLATHADPDHASAYTDFLGTVWSPRFYAFSAGLTNPAAIATAQASENNVTPGASSPVCTDKGLSAQISADVGGFPNLPALSASTVNVYGNAGITVIKIRYTYEDEHVAAACAIALNDGKQFMLLSEDTFLLNILGFLDSANTAGYDAFRVANIVPRTQAIASHFNNDLGFATLLPPTSTP